MNTNEIKSSVKVVGLNGKISLGKEFAGKQVLVEEREPGVWMVRMALVIPEIELWLHHPQIQQGLQRALAYAQAHSPQETGNIDALFGNIENERQQSKVGLE
ncbi:MAG: hypothetical protein ACYCSZ_14130 [Burkholderiales bacterium]